MTYVGGRLQIQFGERPDSDSRAILNAMQHYLKHFLILRRQQIPRDVPESYRKPLVLLCNALINEIESIKFSQRLILNLVNYRDLHNVSHVTQDNQLGVRTQRTSIARRPIRLRNDRIIIIYSNLAVNATTAGPHLPSFGRTPISRRRT